MTIDTTEFIKSLDLKFWNHTQEQFSDLTHASVITIDNRGNPMGKQYGRTPFCAAVCEFPVFRKRCMRCEALAVNEALKTGSPYIYLCHCGLINAAIPIIIAKRYLGSIILGQLRIATNHNNEKMKSLVHEAGLLPSGSPERQSDLLEYYELLASTDYSRIKQVSQLIGSIANHMVETALIARNDAEIYDWLLQAGNEFPEAGNTQISKITCPEDPANGIPVESPVPSTHILYPAVSYILSHPADPMSLSDIAALCHLSPSYFSRLFTREIGEGYNSFVNRQKIQIAKELLLYTNNSVSEIAEKLGYLNVSHFISLFKRLEGVTPLVFRQNR